MLVRCCDCGQLWRRITEGRPILATQLGSDIQTICPACGSHAWEYAKEAPC